MDLLLKKLNIQIHIQKCMACINVSLHKFERDFYTFQGDLKTYLRSHRIALDSFNEKGLLLKFASDMAAGLQALHQGNFIHQ